jgi:hypothetical protein
MRCTASGIRRVESASFLIGAGQIGGDRRLVDEKALPVGRQMKPDTMTTL